MIITDHFAFIHMHKTGGQTLNHIIAKCFPESKHIGYHYPYSMLPPQYKELPLVGMVRNPWDWYVSWYAFNRKTTPQNYLFLVLSDGGQLDFKSTVTNLVNLGDNNRQSELYRKALISAFPETIEGNRGIGLTKSCIRNFSDNRTGYVTWLFNRMLGDIKNSRAFIGRFENLEDNFLGIMKKIGVKNTTDIAKKFTEIKKKNSSNHSHYSQYYDEELRDLIARKEDQLISKYGFQFKKKKIQKTVISLPTTYANDESFKKPLGKAPNFLLLSDNLNIEPIKNKLLEIPDNKWVESKREQQFKTHHYTQSILLIFDDDFRHSNPTTLGSFDYFKDELKPITDCIAEFYHHDGNIIRLLFTKLFPGGVIPPHPDTVFSLLHCHRVHIPILTNEKVFFFVGGEQKNLKEGEAWEINNATIHSVENHSDEERVHLIADWVPKSTLRAEDKPLPKSHLKIKENNGRAVNVGRNEPCPCGSGKRYKYCHGSLV